MGSGVLGGRAEYAGFWTSRTSRISFTDGHTEDVQTIGGQALQLDVFWEQPITPMIWYGLDAYYQEQQYFI